MTDKERKIVPIGFTVGIDESITILTFETGEKPITLRFQHPGCEAQKVGLCLVAYELLAKSDPNDAESLQRLAIDLRDVIQDVKAM